jgi:hypothetical protein
MSKYKSAIYKHLHGEFKDMFADGDISAERLREFEQNCFKESADTPRARTVHQPVISAASPGPQGRSIK